MKRLIVNLPKPVMVALSTMAAVLVLFAILIPVLGGARDDAVNDSSRLTAEIGAVTTALSQAKTDRDYVLANLSRFEDLQRSDRLVPHTRRTAVMELGRVGNAYGMGLNYSFKAAAPNSAKAAASQPKSDAYTLSVESIELKVSAPFDGAVYRFIDDITRSFPGSATVEAFSLKRAAPSGSSPSGGVLALINEGKGSKLVEGDVILLWRTAQAVAQDKK